MKKQIFALFLLVALLAPMFWGIFRMRRLPRHRRDEKSEKD